MEHSLEKYGHKVSRILFDEYRKRSITISGQVHSYDEFLKFLSDRFDAWRFSDMTPFLTALIPQVEEFAALYFCYDNTGISSVQCAVAHNAFSFKGLFYTDSSKASEAFAGQFSEWEKTLIGTLSVADSTVAWSIPNALTTPQDVGRTQIALSTAINTMKTRLLLMPEVMTKKNVKVDIASTVLTSLGYKKILQFLNCGDFSKHYLEKA